VSTVLGVLLIGQEPRPDYEAFFRACLPEDGRVLVTGTLDDLSLEEIRSLPCPEGEPVLVTLSREMVPIKVPAKEAHRRMPDKIRFLEESGAHIIVVICTGRFPFLKSRVPLVFPSEVLSHNVAALAGGKRVGVMVPLPQQIPQLRDKWLAAGVDPVFHAVSPFTEKDLMEEAGLKLAEFDPTLIVMDCMGYEPEMKQAVKKAARRPVIAARSILARVVSELAE